MTPRRNRDGWYDKQPRLPGPSAPRSAGRKPFGATWWGAAWIEALEQRARLDANRLPRGRTYARSGAVGDLELRPGEILAKVQGSRRTPYSVQVRVRVFEDPEWDRVLDALAAEIGHTAALLEGEFPPAVADDVASVGLDLMPGLGELQPRCSCPDWADPCKHSAAVCYLVADELDRDPFGVLLLRGRWRDEVLAELRRRRRGAPTLSNSHLEVGPHHTDPGMEARAAWNRQPEPLPVPPVPPRVVGRPFILGTNPEPGTDVDGGRLRALAIDAASRALELALSTRSSGLELSEAEDLARRAAATLGATGEPPPNDGGFDLTTLARAGGVGSVEMLRRGLAWRDGGPEGLAVLLEDWDPPHGSMGFGRSLLGKGARARRNRATLDDRQFRLGKSGSWYPYRRRKPGQDGWMSDGPPIIEILPDDELD
jgi:uncharacterized Zn finger protein